MEKQLSEGLKQRLAERAVKKEKKAIKGLPEEVGPQSRIVHDPTKVTKPAKPGTQESHGGKIRY